MLNHFFSRLNSEKKVHKENHIKADYEQNTAVKYSSNKYKNICICILHLIKKYVLK